MSFDTPGVETAVWQRRLAGMPPGVAIEQLAPLRDAAPAQQSGVPAFLGFARVASALFDRPGSRAVVLDRWDARLWSGAIAPADGSHLRAAVRGFFANGGRRCVLLATPADTPSSADALLQLVAPGGPLEDRADVDLVCAPDACGPLIEPDRRLSLMHAVLRHCESAGDRLALLDVPALPPTATEDPVRTWSRLAEQLRSRHAALYAPWVNPDPTSDKAPAHDAAARAWRCLAAADAEAALATRPAVPPCGHVAGLIARLDHQRGLQHAPANEPLDGVLGLALGLDARQHGQLNDAGVNCIRIVPGRGIQVAGARTLSNAPQWLHLSSARIVIAFRRWVVQHMDDLAFEPHNQALWDTMRGRLVAHCLDLQQSGALVGEQPGDGFFVQCDAETNPPDERDLGRVVAHVGLAVSVPAEFVLVRVMHDASGFSVGGLS